MVWWFAVRSLVFSFRGMHHALYFHGMLCFFDGGVCHDERLKCDDDRQSRLLRPSEVRGSNACKSELLRQSKSRRQAVCRLCHQEGKNELLFEGES